MDIFSWEWLDWKSGIEFSWDMPLRAFIQWALDQPISTYAYIIGAIACIIFSFKCINWLRNNKDQ